MTIPPAQAEVAALLARLTGAAPVETHISAVFVGRDQALKLKKAVRLGFLDFSGVEDRRRFALRELAVNRAHAPELYRDVVPVTRGPDGALRLGGEGEAVDWVLRMAPVPAGDFLDEIASRGGLSEAMLDSIADAVAAMHEAAPPVPGVDVVAAMGRVLEGNRDAAREAGMEPARIEAWAAEARAALARCAPLVAERAAHAVRRCHGDLHLGNLCLWQGRPTPFDALEFDEAMATVDTGYDLAFLLMDLDIRLGRAAANRVFNRYVARTGDAGLVGALPLWLSLRAVIRAHVEARRGRDAETYLAAAFRYLRPPPARMLAIGGLPGTGKTTLARALAPELGAAPGALILRSDELRKRRFGRAPEERLPKEAYAESVSDAVHATLFALAEQAARAGHAVIADAMFLDPARRDGAMAAARRAGVPFAGFWLEAPLALLRARVGGRRGDASDADLAVLEEAAQADPGAIAWQRLDAADPLPAARAALAQTATASC